MLQFDDYIGILGGEPMLNPEFMQWTSGLLALWPHTPLNILTNGTQLHRWPELYQIMLDNRDRMRLKITIHGLTIKHDTIQKIENFLQGPIYKRFDRNVFPDEAWQKTWSIIRGPDWPDCDNVDDYYALPEHIRDECEGQHDLGPQLWTDINGVTVQVTLVNYFVKSTLRPGQDLKTFTLHDSDPRRAVDNCMSKFCHHFSRGRLHKCGVVGILPDFDQQFYLDISENDRELINSYRPAETSWPDQQLKNFIIGLRLGDPIPQCKFCPESYESIKFDAGVKKIKFAKKANK
jgi:hypothetical protein